MGFVLSAFGYWDFGGKNGLKGVASTYAELPDGRVVCVKDPLNPAIMSDADIIWCIQHSRQARADFDRLFPTLLLEEQDRLTTLVLSNPRVSQLVQDPQKISDAQQHRALTEGILGRQG